jgi:maleate isomerase
VNSDDGQEIPEAVKVQREGKVMRSIRVGMLTPSSNTVLERETYQMIQTIQGVSAHFSRLRVKKMTPEAESDRQFESAVMLEVARLLEDAQVDVLAWNGTAGSWLGPDRDRQLCSEIASATGIPTTTSTLALLEAYRIFGVTRLGLATPYVQELNSQISRCYAQEGIDVVADEWLGLTDNLDVGSLTSEETRDLVVRAARNGAQAVAVVCTNVAATPLVQELEEQLDIPVFDSIVATLWKCLDLVDAPLRPSGFGMLMTTGSERCRG